ncbi:hypothetical protein BOTBODRAFT_171700 [Botryobasidium botryosum FD-172 SS1]|uniref:Copper radical oxidase n=1 Tax=Botryobasidium botryosum (strain FD-172 SS1) TaxID=930990 RepID=A0A067MR04_BOTB1|nr:hypothetical protein BOTBODRAFT_171700 [Botryobasidium botryosum FD-172 SS1]
MKSDKKTKSKSPLGSRLALALLLVPASARVQSRNFTLSQTPAHGPHRRAEPAWNGQVIPGSNTTALDDTPFTPYFVPQGSESVDDTDPSIQYQPIDTWRALADTGCVQRTVHSTKFAHAAVTLSFYGTGIQWFGSKSPKHGIAQVYLDGRVAYEVDGYMREHRKQQRLFGVDDLAYGKHDIKIVNTGRKVGDSNGTWIDVDAFVINHGTDAHQFSAKQPAKSIVSSHNAWSITQTGTTGVAAMQLAIVSETHAIIIDKVEHNPLTIDGHPAWAALYDLRTHQVRPLTMRSNSFCAGGTFLSNGTLASVGGNPVVVDKTGAADFGDVNGLQAVRLFDPCSDGNCDMYENPHRIRLASPRWYNTVTRLEDGSAMIIGGSIKGGWINNGTTNNPTVEYFPPKNIAGHNGLAIHSPFLAETLNSNLFPIAFTLPDGLVFVAANRDAMIYDWRANTERRLPRLPNNVRVTYPMTGTGLLLPLSAANNYIPEILVCGGSAIDDTRPAYTMSANDPASDQCSRMVLDDAGIREGWSIEHMPEARIMPDAVLLPDGRVLIVNGGRTGIAGYGNVKDQVGQSNAGNPVFTPVVYDPEAPEGQRFNREGMPSSNIPRLYHSVATLTPNGTIMVAGSNPNLDLSTTAYQTEYRVEWIYPPYMFKPRPAYGGLPEKIQFGSQFVLGISIPSESSNVRVSLMDLGFVTHAVHMNSRLVVLACTLSDDRKQLTVTAPPSATIYPPGPGWLYVLVDGVPSFGHQTLVGDGANPPEDRGAIENLLRHSTPPPLHQA